MFLIIHGSTACSDLDVHIGLIENKDEAEIAVNMLNIAYKSNNRIFSFEELPILSGINDPNVVRIVDQIGICKK